MTTLPLKRPTTDRNMQRGACPALSAPMQTGDGLLVRVALTEAISPAQLADLCNLARRHGNGMLDISARGNLQIRGLTETSAPLLEADVRTLNLPLRDGLAVETPPLAGLDQTEIADPRPLADAIQDGARGMEGLAPKMSVVIDGHGRLRLSELLADIRLVAVRVDGEIKWKILIGSVEESGRLFNVLRETQAAATVLDLLHQLSERGPKGRGRDLADGFTSNIAVEQHRAEQEPPFSPLAGERGSLSRPSNQISSDRAASSVGSFTLSGGLYATGISLAFGQTTAGDLISLCEEAARLGIKALKPAFDHSLLFFGTFEACETLSTFAAAKGFITTSADPRSHIATCPGSPACASANMATHEIAAHAATECSDLLDGSLKLHVSGCPKGCAHPQAAALTLCGTSAGLSVIHQAKASDKPFATTAFVDTNATLRRLADLVRSERRDGENSAACLTRLGSKRLAATVMSGRP